MKQMICNGQNNAPLQMLFELENFCHLFSTESKEDGYYMQGPVNTIKQAVKDYGANYLEARTFLNPGALINI